MKSTHKHLAIASLLACALAWTGCENGDDMDDEAAVPDTMSVVEVETTRAMAVMQPTEGNNVNGTVTFTKEGNTIRLVADLTGLSEGEHGIHIHENGDCSAPDASSAGGHYAPNGSPHGAPNNPPTERHVGDLGNLRASADGITSYTRVDSLLAFTGTNDIIGKAVIVHQGRDDLTSQPSGDAGARVACGVIEPVNDPNVQEEATGGNALEDGGAEE